MSNLTLAERIANERIEKVAAIQRTVKSLARNPESVNSNLVIQRNLKWTQEQKSSLIESILLGYPVPAIYTMRSEDRQLWILDGKQRIDGTLIRYMHDEWELKGLDLVYGVDVNGCKYSQLPVEFQELIADQNLTFYQFEKLTIEQRDSFFKRLNSGTPLSKIEIIRSILGTENLDYINRILDTPFMKKTGITPAMKEGFKDQELVLQLFGLLTDRVRSISGNELMKLAFDLRANGLTETERQIINCTFEYLSKGFIDIEEKDAKKALKKADVVAVAMAAKNCDVDPEVFANLVVPYINVQKPGSKYKDTKGSGSASAEKVQQRIEILKKVVLGSQSEQKSETQKEAQQQKQHRENKESAGEQLELAV